MTNYTPTIRSRATRDSFFDAMHFDHVTWIHAALALLAAVLWGATLPFVELSTMNDLGLISALPALNVFALVLAIVTFCSTLHRRSFVLSLIIAQIVMIVLMLHGVTALIEETPRFHVTWRHIGISEYITRTGTINPRINAYFNWPGFFIFIGYLAEVANLKSPLSFAMWTPFLINLLAMGPLYLMFSAVTRDKRLVWLAILFYYLANWVGQDYLAPQALNHFFYLVIISIVLRWFRVPSNEMFSPVREWIRVNWIHRLLDRFEGWFSVDGDAVSAALPEVRAGIFVALVLMFLSIVPSHQLTPFFAIMSLSALVLFNRISVRSLPVLMAVLVAVWVIFMATTYLAGHTHKVVGGVGEMDENISVNVTERLGGSPQHLFIVNLRLGFTAVLMGLAGLGALRRLYNGYLDLSFGLLLFAPFPLVIVQPYGGEMILRAFLFALPAVAFLCAAFFFPGQKVSTSKWSLFVLGAASALLVFGFLFARYGNARMEYYTQAEVEATEMLYELAPPGSRLVAAVDYLPWKFQGVDQYKDKVTPFAMARGDMERIIYHMANPDYVDAFFIISRSQKAYAEMFGDSLPGEWDVFEQKMVDSGEFEVVFQNEDARILHLIDREKWQNKFRDDY